MSRNVKFLLTLAGFWVTFVLWISGTLWLAKHANEVSPWVFAIIAFMVVSAMLHQYVMPFMKDD